MEYSEYPIRSKSTSKTELYKKALMNKIMFPLGIYELQNIYAIFLKESHSQGADTHFGKSTSIRSA